jgi:putative DNA primase/helicase
VDFDVEALKASIDLVALVGHYTALRRRGREYVGLCVAHDDRNPSMWVNPEKRIVHCFACDFHADAIDFIQHVEGLDFKAACERLGAKKDWQPRIAQPKAAAKPERITSKPPPEAPKPNRVLRGLGEPSRTWTYKDADGSLIGYVARYEAPDGKQIRCWSWGQRGDEPHAWGCGAWSKPRPLYGLDRLEARRGAPVLIVEGEKAADAAQEKLGQYVVVTWPGGAKAWKHADYEPLRGRRVDLWPDNDVPGIDAMHGLKTILADPRGLACYGKIIDPNRMPDGYDAADWTGTSAELIDWLRERATEYPEKPAPEPAAAVLPPETAPPVPEDIAAARKRKPRLVAVDGNTALAPEEQPQPVPVALSEDAFAMHFADDHGENWRCVKAWGKWFHWDGEAWAEDRTDSRVDPMRELFRQAQHWPQASELNASSKRSIFGKQVPMYSALRLAGTDRRIRAEPEIWDADPWSLGVPGGAVDLQSGRMTKSAREHHLTMRCSVAPEKGEPALWLKLLEQWLGDADVVGFLRRYLGYSLTGDNREQCMTFFYGPAQSGKGTIMRAVAGILGSGDEANKFRPYHYEAPISTFMESRNDRHTTELAAFYKKRLITSEEPSAGAKWDEGKLKWITGGSQITARFISQDNFSFTMTGKIIVAANHRPRLSTTDKAIRRRMHVIPFEHPVADEDRDNQLDAKLRAEWPQILNWMVEGCLEWQDSGLGLPERISSSTDDYLESEDTLGAWILECCERDSGDSEGKSLYESYRKWCEVQGEHSFSRRGWTNALLERGFQTRKGTAGTRMVRGLCLKLGANL